MLITGVEVWCLNGVIVFVGLDLLGGSHCKSLNASDINDITKRGGARIFLLHLLTFHGDNWFRTVRRRESSIRHPFAAVACFSTEELQFRKKM